MFPARPSGLSTNLDSNPPFFSRSIKSHSKMAEPAHKRHDLQTSADLERVTDYAEETEIQADIGSVSITLEYIQILFLLCTSKTISKAAIVKRGHHEV